MRRPFSAGVWSNRAFVRLWTGQSVSAFGSYISVVAVPLLAIGSLHARAADMGVLGAASRLPFLLYVFAGVFVDRTRRRQVMIGADLIRAALLLLIPVAVLTGVLSLWLLAAAWFAVQALEVWFETASMSYLPSLVERGQLLDANTGLEGSLAAAQTAGPGLGGLLVQAVSAPVALVADAVSFLASAFMVWRIGGGEPAPAPAAGPGVRGVLTDVAEGFQFIGSQRALLPLAIAIAVMNVVWAAEVALYVLFLVRDLGLPASLLGLTLAGAGPGALVGTALAGPVQRRVGLSAAIVGGLTTFAVSALLIPAAPAVPAVAVPMLTASGFLMALDGQVCAVNVITARQVLTPDRLQGRVNASFHFLILGLSPAGSVAGGLLGQAIGVRPALLVAVAGMFVAPLLVLASPVRGVREVAPVEAS